MKSIFNLAVKKCLLPCFLVIGLMQLHAQKSRYQIQVEPENPRLNVGETLQLKAVVLDEKGNVVEGEKLYYYSRRGRIVEVDENGLLTGVQGGTANLIVLRPDEEGRYTRKDVSVSVNFPAVGKIEFRDIPSTFYTGTSYTLKPMAIDILNNERTDLEVTVVSADKEVANVNDFNVLRANKAGKVKLLANAEGIEATYEIEVLDNPVSSLDVSAPFTTMRTGDVVQLQVMTKDKNGNEVDAVPVSYAFKGKSTNPSYSAGGMIEQDGRFVAYEPGLYEVTAACGEVASHISFKVEERDVQRGIEFIGKGAVNKVHTSDLWVWEGIDGNDYAVTGTWGANGEAYFWDVSDPANMKILDTVTVDARTVNDVKVSEDGRVCIISREGASNRKNGIVILDVTDPSNVKQHAVFDEGLTGGVHNLFIYKKHVYALSNGERYDIINIEDPSKPKKVGSFELDSPGHAIHDVWIEDGIAYSSNWHDGVQLVDIGNGIKGGTPSSPKKIGSYAYPSGWNHAAFPFRSPSTGKFYVIAGDEAFPTGININDEPTYAGGYIHVIDFTDMENPKEVAHYEVPGAGSHNFWVDGETLYLANYNAGLRVIDISGDLLGDLFKQGREIGKFIPADPKGRIPNAPMTWGPQPHKGHIFFSDWNSGIWSVKMEQKEETNIE